MKYNLKPFLSGTLLLVLFFACKKETNPYFATGTTPALTSSATSVSMVQADSASTAVTFSWTNPNFATDSNHVKYIVEIDSSGKNFVNEYTQTISGSRSFSLTAAQLNSILLNSFGFYYDSTYSIDVRVTASYTNNNDQHLTNVVTLSVTPYRPLLPYTALWVAGDYEGWNPANATQLAYGAYSSLLNATAFDGYVTIPAGGTNKILFASSPDWTHGIYYDSAGTDFNYTAYGLGGGGDLSTSSGDTLALPFSGYFEINVDTVGNKWYYIPISSWGVIGSFAERMVYRYSYDL